MPITSKTLQAAIGRSNEIELELEQSPESFRILTGDRPTGLLHVGHYFGTLQNRVRLQNLGVETFVLIADYQVLTDRDKPDKIKHNVFNLMLDYLAVGIDPTKSTIFTHSYIKSLNQLIIPFLSLVSVSELERNPTVKDEITTSKQKTISALMFTYPIHQAADILFAKANLVPAGRDQLPHIEVARDIARRFNERYCPGQDFFPLPETLLSTATLLLGIDGKKMGKSLNNSISISSTSDQTAALLKRAKTDSERSITYDPINRPEVSNLVLLGSLCCGISPQAFATQIPSGGSQALKSAVTEAVNEYFTPIRKRRAEFGADPSQVMAMLAQGNNKASDIGDQTLSEVRRLMDMYYY